MSKGEKKPAAPGGNVVDLAKVLCVAEDCKKKASRAEFCDEHFVWYKEGLLTGKGEKPRDFDKKYVAFIHRNKPAA